MSPFMNLEIFRSGKHFSTSWKRTREWLLSGVDPNVVDQLVLGLKWLSNSWTVVPKTNVV